MDEMTPEIRVIVVDDEEPARQELTWLLEQCEAVRVTAQLGSAKEALNFIEESAPVDLVFLDIDMPGIDGVRLAQLWSDRLGEDAPLVAFVTAYDEHAVEAFALDAVDYLLKPVRLARVRRALEKARRRMPQNAPKKVPGTFLEGVGGEASSPVLERISVEELGEYRVIAVDDILWVEADEGFATVHTEEGDFLTDFSLKFLEENLDAGIFFRCHRSYIVRLDAISRISPWGAGTYRLVVGDGSVPLARSRAPDLKARIPWSANAF